MKSKIGFVVPVVNNFKGCIEAICSIKTGSPYSVYIQEQWREHKPLAKAWNDGVDKAITDGCDYIFIINDDILFAPTGVDNAIKEFDRLQKYKVVLVSLNNKMGGLNDPYHILAWHQPYEIPNEVADHPNFSCFMVGKDFFKQAGRFDENYAPAWWEDNDMHYRLHLLGLRAVCTVTASCVHFGGVTTAMLPESNRSSERSSQYFVRKWGSAKRDMDEEFKTPYNDPKLTPKDWIPNYA